jgi:hypothetical protein
MRSQSLRTRRTTLIGLLTVVVLAVVVSLTAASPALAITADDCATARSWGYTQTDVEIAHDAALTADGVLEAIPQDSLSSAARVAAVAVWAVPQGVYRGFEHIYNIASACDDSDHQQLVKDNLDAKVSTRASQASLDDQADLDLRLKIEENLGGNTPIALFELPASQGGYIQLARTIVDETITKMLAAGEKVRNAPVSLAKADTLIAAQRYKAAYEKLMAAYRDASRLTT